MEGGKREKKKEKKKSSFGYLVVFLLVVLFVCLFAAATRMQDPQFPNQGSNPCPLQWKHGVLTNGPPLPCILK